MSVSFLLMRSIRQLNILSFRVVNETVKLQKRKCFSNTLPITLFEKQTNKIKNLLLNYGFSNGQVTRILNSSHSVLSLSKEDLLSNLMSWSAFEANNKIHTVLSSYPELLTLTPEYINNRANELLRLFTKKDINKLLYTCPKVFLDDLDTIQEKVEYIVHNMGVEQKSIVKSEALQFDLNHIKCRHIFLSRVGIYKKMKKTLQSKNPPLNKVFSRNITTFLKLSGLSNEEYEAFGEAYEFEEDLRIEEAEDSDEDS